MNNFKQYPILRSALSIIVAGIVLIAVYFIFLNMETVKNVLAQFFSIISPFVYGSFIAFLISPIARWFEYRALSIFKCKQKTKHNLAVIITLVVVVEIIILFFAVLIPQFVTSVSSLSESFPNYLDSFNLYIAPLLENYMSDQTWILDFLNSSSDLAQSVINLLQEYIPNIVDFSLRLTQSIFKATLSIVIAIYILLDEEGFAVQIKRFITAFLGPKAGKNINELVSLTSFMMQRFILGKAFNSVVMGVSLYVLMLLLNISFPVFLSTIFGFTNMIPFFGPFVGGAFGVIILVLQDPTSAFWFLIIILILQQIEGSILSPLVIGDSMGLPGIWVFFAIIVGGGYFGVIGMFLGAPIFAVIYLLLQRNMDKRLAKQESEN